MYPVISVMKMNLECLWSFIRFLTTGALEDLIGRKKCITHLIVIWLETFMTRTPTREIMFTEVRNISNMTVSKVPYKIDSQYLQKLDYILLLIRNVQPPSINFMTFSIRISMLMLFQYCLTEKTIIIII